MGKTATALAVVLLAVTATRGDTVTTAIGVSYTGVKITGVKDCRLILTGRPGMAKPKPQPLARVKFVKIAGRKYATFNKAETLASKGKWADALKEYDAAAKKPGRPWTKKLVDIRRLRALDNAGRIDEAVDLWLAIVDENRASANALALCPSHPAKKKSPRNDKAIQRLEAALASLKTRKGYAKAITELLMQLHRQQGQSDKAADLATALAAGPKAPAATPAKPEKPGDKMPPAAGASLLPERKSSTPSAPSAPATPFSAMEVLLESGKAGKALAIIEANLAGYPRHHLPAALLLRGRAQARMAENASGEKKTKLLLQAGLNLMRVASEFPAAPEASEALLSAGRIHAMLPTPNLAAARAAYEAVIDAEGEKSVVGEKARTALKALAGS